MCEKESFHVLVGADVVSEGEGGRGGRRVRGEGRVSVPSKQVRDSTCQAPGAALNALSKSQLDMWLNFGFGNTMRSHFPHLN